MFYYAQIDENNICVGVSQLSGEVNAPNMILLESYDSSLFGKKYNGGVWEEVHAEPQLEQQLLPTEQAILQAAINTEYMMSLMEIKG